MLKQLKLFYYFYETDVIRNTNDTDDTKDTKDTKYNYNNITGID
jgi:hypothetical protein